MNKIISTFRINEALMLKTFKIMNDPNYTDEEKRIQYEPLNAIYDFIDELVKNQRGGCTCEDCNFWDLYTGDKEAFSADGGYLGYCKLHKHNTQQSDFCSESLIKNYTEKI